MAEMTDFEKTLLDKVDRMNENLSVLTERLTSFEGETKQALAELSGRIKGNHELIKSEIQTYVEKDTCESHRERQGNRIKEAEDRILRLEGSVVDLLNHEQDRRHNANDRLTAWMPSIIILIAVIGGMVWIFAGG